MRFFSLFYNLYSRQKTLFGYSTATITNSVSGMFCGLVIIGWVPPEDLGLWKSLLILQSYASIFQGGIRSGLNRELPFRIGSGDYSQVRQLTSTTQAFSIATLIFLLLAAVFCFVFFSSSKIRFALFAVLYVAALSIYSNFLLVTYRAKQQFALLTKFQFIFAFSNLATLPIVYSLGFFGIPFRVFFISSIQAFLLHLYRPIKVPSVFRLEPFLSLAKVGIPLFITGYLIQVSLTFPNTTLLIRHGTSMVGLFVPSMAIFSLMTLVPKSIGQYVYSKMNYRLGKTGDFLALWRYALKSSMGLLSVSIPFIIFVSYLFPVFIRAYYPKYNECTDSIPWITIAGALFGSQVFLSALYSMKAWKNILHYTVFRLISAFCLPFLFLLMLDSKPLLAVSIGYAIAGLFCFLFGILLTYRSTHFRLL